jgi:hypothetical protein
MQVLFFYVYLRFLEISEIPRPSKILGAGSARNDGKEQHGTYTK